jgi:hypothetical protein
MYVQWKPDKGNANFALIGYKTYKCANLGRRVIMKLRSQKYLHGQSPHRSHHQFPQ